ncbi:MAG: hypothetical protein IKW30_10690 [Lachnospiraceae bacterium]|nr:hypothetical protein [Lachnospiraceae bacterium]
MKSFKERQKVLMDAAGINSSEKSLIRQIDKCVELELAIAKEIEEAVKQEAPIIEEITRENIKLNQVVQEKFHLIFEEDIKRIQQNKFIVAVAQNLYKEVLKNKNEAEKNSMSIDAYLLVVGFVNACKVLYRVGDGNMRDENTVDLKFPDTLRSQCEYVAELAIIQLVEKFFQLDRTNVEVFCEKRSVNYIVDGGYANVDTEKHIKITFTEKVDAVVKQQAEKIMTANEFAQKVLNSKNTEKVAEWLVKNVEVCLENVDKEPSNKFIELPFELAVYEKMVVFETKNKEECIEEKFEFEANNMQRLLGDDMCIGLAKAIVTLLKLKLKENHEFADIKDVQMGNKYKLAYHEINSEYSGLTGWEE